MDKIFKFVMLIMCLTQTVLLLVIVAALGLGAYLIIDSKEDVVAALLGYEKEFSNGQVMQDQPDLGYASELGPDHPASIAKKKLQGRELNDRTFSELVNRNLSRYMTGNKAIEEQLERESKQQSQMYRQRPIIQYQPPVAPPAVPQTLQIQRSN